MEKDHQRLAREDDYQRLQEDKSKKKEQEAVFRAMVIGPSIIRKGIGLDPFI